MPFEIVHLLIIAFGVTLGVLFILALDRRLNVASQHRIGSARAGYGFGLQVIADIVKAATKTESAQSSGKGGKIFWSIAFFLPYLFAFILFSSVITRFLGGFELLVLFLILLVSRLLDAFALNSAIDGNERYQFRKNLVLSIIGLTAIIFSCLTVILKIGGGSKAALSEAQAQFPYYLLFKGPGIFLAAITSLIAIFLVLEELPVGGSGAKSIHGRKNHAFIFLDRLWLFVLACFWVVLFAGGAPHGIFVIGFAIRVLILLIIVLWAGRVIPPVRQNDALELGVSVILPVTLFAFILESAYLVFSAVGIQ